MSAQRLFRKILITGCGGDIAISISRLLRETNMADRLIGIDVSDDHPGFAFYDKTDIVPLVTAPHYLQSIQQVVEENGIDVIIPMSEPEIRFFTDRNMDSVNNVKLIMASHDARKIGFDKLKTACFLEDHGLPFPWTTPVCEGPPKETPCILKSPSGRGSKTVRIVDTELVDFYRRSCINDIWQELLLPHDQEYTCGVYRTKAEEVRTIILRRSLVGGFTGKAEICTNKDISELLITMAKKLELYGSINIQLRLTARGPVIFEINPRFSSTVSLRHRVGFCDLVWSLQEAVERIPPPYQPADPGIRLYRVPSDYIAWK